MKIAVMGEIHQDGWEVFRKIDADSFELFNFDEDKLKEQLVDVDGILLRTAKLSNDLLSHCKKLKIISRHGVGYDNIDLEYLTQNRY